MIKKPMSETPTTPAPPLSITNEEEQDPLVNAPSWAAFLCREIQDMRREVRALEANAIDREKAEQKRADVRHEDAQRLQKEFFNFHKNYEFMRRQVEGARKDFTRATERIDEYNLRLNEHHERIATIELTLLPTKKEE